MKSSDIRKSFLDYFSRNSHSVIPSSSLIPEGDPTLLFTNAGMVQFKKVFLGDEKRPAAKAATCQKCMRAGGKHNDLENVGRTGRHHTFFEMLGNFSFGDYFKTGAIELAWGFLTGAMKLSEDKLWVTVFEDDDEAGRIWREGIGVKSERIKRLGEDSNFWSMGGVGPCGPCSEILLDQGEGVGCGKPGCAVGCDCDRFLELWNLVFMQYNKSSSGEMTPLPKPSIDTGMGLERLAAVMQGKTSNYESDLFTPIIESVEEISSVKYGGDQEKDASIRAIADHSRAIAFLIGTGLMPSNEGRGYVLRRIMRRAARHGRFLGIEEPFLYKTASRVVTLMGGVYPELVRSEELIRNLSMGEEERFLETLERGLDILGSEVEALRRQKKTVIPGDVAFKLYDTYGFPSDLTADIVKSDGFIVDEEGFELRMNEQRERSASSSSIASAVHFEGKLDAKLIHSTAEDAEKLRSRFIGYLDEAASSRVTRITKDGQPVESARAGDKVEIITEETPFYGESGGQAGDTGVMAAKGVAIKVTDTKRPSADVIIHRCLIEEGGISVGDEVELRPDMERRKAACRNHTATHILHAVLRQTLGPHVRQAGSLVSHEGFRFDFNHYAALKDKEIDEIEQRMNAAVRGNMEVATSILPYDEALKKGALAFFGEKYGATVRLVQVDNLSAELCGGTHVKMTGDIGLVKITSEGSVSSGVRRIEAVTSEAALKVLNESERHLSGCAAILKVPKDMVAGKIKKLIERQKELEKELDGLRRGRKGEDADGFLKHTREIGGVKVLAIKADAQGPEELRKMADMLRAKLKSGIVVIGSTHGGKAIIIASVTQDLVKRFSAGEIVKRLAPNIGGKGGGKADMAQAGGKDADRIDETISILAPSTIAEMAGEK
ncbi:MAG: alanine--tRNA ligase [Deltaproteobacteria bacterium]|nr:alanine--tRNA ligase [Deltaproteobacteria bacterium]